MAAYKVTEAYLAPGEHGAFPKYGAFLFKNTKRF